MSVQIFHRVGVIAFSATLTLTGCLHQATQFQEPEASLEVVDTEGDARLEFLQKSGFERENIHVAVDTISKPGKRDTLYMLVPQISAAAKAKGVLGTAIGFRGETIDSMITRKNARGLAVASEASGKDLSGIPPLAKQSQTRLNVWNTLLDVKALTEVHQVRIFIETIGPGKMGPNWQAGIRAAIANWNADAKGSAASFVETLNRYEADIIARGSFGVGPDGTLVSSVVVTGDPWVYPDGIQIWVNIGYEMNTPHNQMATSAMKSLGYALNIGINEQDGRYVESPHAQGNFEQIPGTPYSDGDPWTPGSSLFTHSSSPASTPAMTASDLKTVRLLYPSHGLTSRLSNGQLQIVGQKQMVPVSNNVIQFETSNDTLYYLRSDGYLFRRIGLTGGQTVQLWPGSYTPAGQVGNLTDFVLKNGYLAARTWNGRIVTRPVNGSTWNAHLDGAIHYINSGDFRLDGTTIYWRNAPQFNPGSMRIWYKSLTSPYSSINLLWNGNMGVTDYQVHNGTAVIIQDGSMYGSTNHGGSWTMLHHVSNGTATHVRLTDHLMGMFYYPNGSSWGSMGVRHINFHLYPTFPVYYTDPMTSIDDVSMCGARMAYLQQSLYLRIANYAGGNTVHMAYFLPQYSQVNRVKLHGEDCEYVTATAPQDNLLLGKYGISNNTGFIGYQWNTIGLR